MRFRPMHGVAALATVLVIRGVTMMPGTAGAAIYPAPSGATLEFEAAGVDGGAGNAVLVAGETLATLTQDAAGFVTMRVQVPGRLLRSGRLDVTLAAGNTGTDQTEGYDDIEVRDLRLVLADGTRVTDERYAPSRPYHIGDGLSLTEDPQDLASFVPTNGHVQSDTEEVLRRDFRFRVPLTGRSAADAPAVPVTHASGNGLNVAVSDPDGDRVRVDILGAAEAELVRAQAGVGYAKPHEANPGATTIELPDAELLPLTAADGSSLETRTSQGLPTQEFTLRVDPEAAPPHLEVVWQGRTSDERGATMYVWDLEQRVWAEVASASDADEDTTLTGALDVASTMSPEGLIRLQVQEKRFTADESDFAFAWLTDTQFSSERFPQVYDTMNRWIVDNAEKENIVYAIHTGDITQNYNRYEWEWQRASASMRILEDGGVPYGIVTGNHDIGAAPTEPGASDHVYYDEYFPASRFQSLATESYRYGGNSGNNRNHYDLVSHDGMDFLFLYMDWAASDADIAWANQVLQSHPDRRAVFATHQYIDPNGKYTKDGKKFFDQVIVPNDNLFMVLSGHHVGAAYNVRRIPLPNGGTRVVFEILHDYQGGPDGGSGYLRLMRVDLDDLQIDQQPYSPYTDDFDYGAEKNGWTGFPVIPEARDDYTLSLDLAPIDRLLSTDRIALLVRTGEVLASVASVASGKNIHVSLPADLPPGYLVRLTDPAGGIAESVPHLRD